MHDAMQVYWSRFANIPQWSLWAFFASLHEQGTSLGGIMFDDIVPIIAKARQFSSTRSLPRRQPRSAAGGMDQSHVVLDRLSRNRAHVQSGPFLAEIPSFSREGAVDSTYDEPEARSFMIIRTEWRGRTSLFKNFEFRFSDDELLFLRHAPARFVQMGNADWFDHHGFQEEGTASDFRLELAAQSRAASLEYMEPASLSSSLRTCRQSHRWSTPSCCQTRTYAVVVKRDGQPAQTTFLRQLVLAAIVPGC